MTAKRLQIHARHRQHMGIITPLADFDWREGEAVHAAGLPDRCASRYALRAG